MSLVIPYPLINGARPDFASIEMSILGTANPILVPIIGFKSISYKTSTNGKQTFGAARYSLGETIGEATAEGSIEMYKPEYRSLIQALGADGDGYMEVFFTILLTYAAGPTLPIMTDELYGVRIADDDESHQTGGESLTVKFNIHVNRIVKSGVEAVSSLPSMAANALPTI